MTREVFFWGLLLPALYRPCFHCLTTILVPFVLCSGDWGAGAAVLTALGVWRVRGWHHPGQDRVLLHDEVRTSPA